MDDGACCTCWLIRSGLLLLLPLLLLPLLLLVVIVVVVELRRLNVADWVLVLAATPAVAAPSSAALGCITHSAFRLANSSWGPNESSRLAEVASQASRQPRPAWMYK